MSPLFAKYSKDHGIAAGIYCAAVVSCIVSGLYTVLANTEDSFDGTGVDDLSLESLSKHTQFMFGKTRKKRKKEVLVKRKHSQKWKKVDLSETMEIKLAEHSRNFAKATHRYIKRESAPFLYFSEPEDFGDDQDKKTYKGDEK